MRFFKTLFFLSLFSGVDIEAKNLEFSIFSFRSPVAVFKDEKRSQTVFRGMLLQPGDQFIVGSRGGVTYDTPSGSTLSVIGPALLRVDYDAQKVPRIFVDYGDVYLRKVEEDIFDFQSPSFQLSHSEDAAELYFESPMGTNFFRLRNLEEEELPVGSRLLETGHTISQNAQLVTVELSRSDDLKRCRERHFNNRQNQDLSTVGDEAFDPSKLDTLSGFFEILPFAGTTKFFVENTTLAQYTGFVGMSLKMGTHIYMGLPKEPKRVDFIYSPLIRIGLDVGGYSGNIHFNATDFVRPHLLYANGVLGIGMHGASVDFIYGYAKSPTAADTRFQLRRISGVDFQYRIDLKDVSGSETGFVFGIRALNIPLEEITANLQTSTGLTVEKVNTMNLAPILGISMRF